MVQQIFNEILMGVNFIIHLFIIGIAVVNFRVILQTGVVHPNLKFVLLVQSFVIAGWSITEIANIGNHFMQNDFNISLTRPLLLSIDIFFQQYVTVIGHVLLIERVLATVFVSCYENFLKPYFSIAWFIFLTSICSINFVYCYIGLITIGQSSLASTKSALLINYIALFLGFIEIIAIYKMGLYNASKYSMNKFYMKARHSLSERYQLSENIRTGRQLGIIFVMHFIQILATCIMFAIQNLQLPVDMNIAVPINYFTMSIANLVIVISVICVHPVLKNKALRTARTIRMALCQSRRIEPSSSAWQHNAISMRDLQSSEITDTIDVPISDHKFTIEMTNLHFELLKKSWSEC